MRKTPTLLNELPLALRSFLRKRAVHRKVLVGIAALIAVIGMALFGRAALADTYTYDAYARLISVTYTDGSTTTYTYDAAGNRTTVTQTAAP